MHMHGQSRCGHWAAISVLGALLILAGCDVDVKSLVEKGLIEQPEQPEQPKPQPKPKPQASTCSFAVYDLDTTTPATRLDTGYFDTSGASVGGITIVNSGRQPLQPTIRAARSGPPRGDLPTIHPGESRNVTLIWAVDGQEIADILPVHNQPVNDTLFVGAACGSTTAITTDAVGAEVTEHETALTAIWYDSHCRWSTVSIEPTRAAYNTLELEYDPVTRIASLDVTVRTGNVGVQRLRMKVLRPPSVLHIAVHPDGFYSGTLTGIDVEHFTIKTNGSATELPAAQREFATGEDIEFTYTIEADMSGFESGIYGTEVTFFGFESVLPPRDVCSPRDRVLRDARFGGRGLAPAFNFYVRIP